MLSFHVRDQNELLNVLFPAAVSTVDTPTAGQQGVNITGNGTNGGLENPLSENITSLTGT